MTDRVPQDTPFRFRRWSWYLLLGRWTGAVHRFGAPGGLGRYACVNGFAGLSANSGGKPQLPSPKRFTVFSDDRCGSHRGRPVTQIGLADDANACEIMPGRLGKQRSFVRHGTDDDEIGIRRGGR